MVETVRYQSPLGSGAMALEQFAVAELPESKHDFAIALGFLYGRISHCSGNKIPVK